MFRLIWLLGLLPSVGCVTYWLPPLGAGPGLPALLTLARPASTVQPSLPFRFPRLYVGDSKLMVVGSWATAPPAASMAARVSAKLVGLGFRMCFVPFP